MNRTLDKIDKNEEFQKHSTTLDVMDFHHPLTNTRLEAVKKINK